MNRDIRKILKDCPENIKEEWTELCNEFGSDISINWYAYDKNVDSNGNRNVWVICPFLDNQIPFIMEGQFGMNKKKRDEFNQDILNEIKGKMKVWEDFINSNEDPAKFIMHKMPLVISKSYFPIKLLEIFKKKGEKLTDEMVWGCIENTWTLAEQTSNEWWLDVFALRKVPEHYTEDLPDKMTVWRGGDPRGYSWTLDQELGQWFAERYGLNQRFCKMEIKKEDVLFYTKLRDEEEIIVIPQDHHIIDEIGYMPKRIRLS